MGASGVLAPVLLGVALGTSFNPLTGLVGSAAAAALVGSPKSRTDRRLLAAGTLLAAWVLGDGLRVLGRAREAYDAAAAVAPPTAWEPYAPLAFWALLGLACYVVPAWMGAFVGRRVTRGTGWLSAAAVAASLSIAFSTGAPWLAEAIRSLAAAVS